MKDDNVKRLAWLRASRKLDQIGKGALWDLSFTWFIARGCRRMHLPVSRDTEETRPRWRAQINTVVRSFMKAGWVISAWEFRKLVRLMADDIEEHEDRPRKREDRRERDFRLRAGR